MAITPLEICELLDEKMDAVIQACRVQAATDPINFNGSLVGFLLKTGIHIASENGMPRSVLEHALEGIIIEAYGAQP